VDLVNYGVNGDEILDVEVQFKAESVDNARWSQQGFNMQKRQNWSKKQIAHMLQHGKAPMPINPSLQIDSGTGDPAAG